MLNLHSVESKGLFSTATYVKYSASVISDDDGPVELDTLWTRDLERSRDVESIDVSMGSTET
jgi:hypothetical protein